MYFYAAQDPEYIFFQYRSDSIVICQDSEANGNARRAARVEYQ